MQCEITVLYIFVLGLTQSTDFLPFVGLFSPCRAKIDLQKKEKYHAAAGCSHFCVSPKYVIFVLLGKTDIQEVENPQAT
jgi:hypothetical protein